MLKYVPLFETFVEQSQNWDKIREFLSLELRPERAIYAVAPIDEYHTEFALVLDYTNDASVILVMGGVVPSHSRDKHALVHVGLIPADQDEIVRQSKPEYHLDFTGTNYLKNEYRPLYDLIDEYYDPDAWEAMYRDMEGQVRAFLMDKYDEALADAIIAVMTSRHPN